MRHRNAYNLPKQASKIEATQGGGQIEIKRCELASPIASLALSGRLNPPGLAAQPLDFRHLIQHQAFQLSGQVDLAALGRQLPQAMHLRDDVQLSSGIIRWDIAQQPNADGAERLTGQIESQDLSALRGTETIRLHDPVRLRFRLGVDAQGPFAEELVVQAPFLSLDARGRLQQGQLTGESDLTRVDARVGSVF